MDDRVITISALAVAFAVLIVLFRRGATRNGLFVVAAFFTLFAFGPVINHLLDGEIYSGIISEYIQQASIGFASAMIGILFADVLAPQRTDYGPLLEAPPSPYRYDLLPFALLAAVIYVLFRVVPYAGTLIGADKIQALALAGPWHYTFMSVATSLAAFYFVTRRSRLMRNLYLAFVVAFVVYCMAFRERDFFLIFVSILVHREIISQKTRPLRMVFVGVASALAATWLFAARSGDSGVNVTGVLNQGSILFVDTFLMSRVPASIPYEFGQTYFDAFARLLPDFVYSSGAPTLSERLVQWYNPGSSSGYGFSLSGEAFLNFGMLGIPAVFFVVALAARYLMNRLDRGDLYPFVSIFFLQAWMYSLRGDSLQLLKTTLFATIVFVFFRLLSSKETSANDPAWKGRPAKTY